MKELLRVVVRPIKTFFANRRNGTLLFALSKLPDSNCGITLIDIGAAGEIESRWKRIEPILHYVGFEPDERSRLLLLQSKPTCASYQLLHLAVWDKTGSVELNLCRNPQVSSHYLPNRQFTDLFPDPHRFDVLSTEKLETTTLDNLQFDKSDFIKIDIQGGELNALKGGQSLLDKTLGLEIEVEFVELYKNQPLFGEICSFLSEHGFEFIDFINLCRWERLSHNGYGQCVFGDALFLRSPEKLLGTHLNIRSVSKYLSICLIYNRFDLIDKIISLLPDSLSESHAAFLKAIKPIRKSNRIVRMIQSSFSSVLSWFGLEYRSHLIY